MKLRGKRGEARALLAGLLLAGLGTTGACNLIVDAGKYSVGNAGGGGEDGSVADVANGDSGGGMDSGALESGPVTCGNGLASGPAFDQLVEGCLLTISCTAQAGYFFDDMNMNYCMTYDYLHSRQGYADCLASVHSCADVFNCTHSRGATVADCPNMGASASCNGNLAITCSGVATGFVQDCSPSALGGTCTVQGTYAGCAIPPSCTGDAGQCQGNAYFGCYNGVGFGRNCGAGFTCGNGSDGPGCYFNAPSCASPGTEQCRSTGVLDKCSTSKQLFPENCAASGSTCALDDAGLGYCLSPGCSLSSQQSDLSRSANPTCKESCSADGKTLNTCIGGAPFHIDCTKYDTFSKCTQNVDTSVTPNPTIVYCE